MSYHRYCFKSIRKALGRTRFSRKRFDRRPFLNREKKKELRLNELGNYPNKQGVDKFGRGGGKIHIK